MNGKEEQNHVLQDLSPSQGLPHRVKAAAGYGRTPVHVDDDHDDEHDEHESRHNGGGGGSKADDEKQAAEELDPRQQDGPEIEYLEGNEPVGRHRLGELGRIGNLAHARVNENKSQDDPETQSQVRTRDHSFCVLPEVCHGPMGYPPFSHAGSPPSRTRTVRWPRASSLSATSRL